MDLKHNIYCRIEESTEMLDVTQPLKNSLVTAVIFTPVIHITFLFFFLFKVKLTKVSGKDMAFGGQNQIMNAAVWKIHHAMRIDLFESLAAQWSEGVVLRRIACPLSSV